MPKRFSYAIVCLTFILILVSACQPAPTPLPTPVPPTATPLPPTPTAIAPLEEETRAPLWTFATQGEVWSSRRWQMGRSTSAATIIFCMPWISTARS
jgi:hypothetical protein